MPNPFLPDQIANQFIIQQAGFLLGMFNAISDDPQASWYLAYAAGPNDMRVLKLKAPGDLDDHQRFENMIARHRGAPETDTVQDHPSVLWALVKSRREPNATDASHYFKNVFSAHFAPSDALKPPFIPEGAIVKRAFDETVIATGADPERSAIFRYPIIKVTSFVFE